MIAGCLPADPPFSDKGRGVWIELPGAPAMTYRAIGGAERHELFAVGDGGIARFDGETWHLVDGVPATTYRAIWGRSAAEVWIGGDNALLARSLTGWQAQALFDGPHPITEYAVLALGGDAAHEYAIVMTGGTLLLLTNSGSVWETPYWRSGDGPTSPFPQQPSLLVHGGGLLVAGAGGLVTYRTTTDLGVPMWEGYRAADVPPLHVISGGPGFWVAAGGSSVVIQRDAEDSTAIAGPRDPRAIVASRANRFFLAGESTIEACDEAGCVPERVEAAHLPLHALWGDDSAVIAVGDGVIVERRACGTRHCSDR
jgi:hypothetical protein